MVLNTSFNELVFENRHKNYGAYQIRKSYSRNVLLAGFLAVAFFSSALGAYFINKPDKNGTLVIPDQPKPTDTLIMIINPDQPKQQENTQRQRAPKGNSSMTSSLVVAHDSLPPVSPADTFGIAKGVPGGKGKLADTLPLKVVPPCLNCDSPKVVKRVTWVPSPKDPGLDEFFRKNIHYPEMAKEQGIEGVVYLTFVVDTKGDVKEIKIAKGAHPLLDNEVLRVAKKMPKWDPVKDQDGEIVEYQYSKPVRFKLEK
jgi:protein TonB